MDWRKVIHTPLYHFTPTKEKKMHYDFYFERERERERERDEIDELLKIKRVNNPLRNRDNFHLLNNSPLKDNVLYMAIFFFFFFFFLFLRIYMAILEVKLEHINHHK